MASEPREWTVPASLRALLWWPPIALVVAMVDPAASASTIALVGVGLAVLGVGAAGISSRIGRRRAGSEAAVGILPEPAEQSTA